MMRNLATLIPHILAVVTYAIGLSYASQHFEFESPALLWLGALIALHIGLRLHVQSGQRFSGLVWSWESPESQLTWKTMGFQCIPEIPYALRTLTIGLLTIAAARPQSSSSVEDLTREGIDIVLSMELSASMLSKDFDPNRLEASKTVATDFVNDRPNDRIGVVAYEGEAFTQIPLTTDQRVVMNGIGELQTGLLEGGTAIGMGLATAVNRLKDSEAESKVVILLTDGVNNAGTIEPLDAAQLAKLNDIRVYTIGVGTIGKARSPVANKPIPVRLWKSKSISSFATSLNSPAAATSEPPMARSWRAFTPKSTNWRKPGSTCFATTRKPRNSCLMASPPFWPFSSNSSFVNSPSAP